MPRLSNLDYLRGLAAFAIMIYHYCFWWFGIPPANTFLARIGIYGVSIFYVLSGLTLHYVYFDKMKGSVDEIVVFFKKRIFRIFPLLWLVTALGIIMSTKEISIWDVFLNFTGLFGFFKWDTYFSTGAWSIGNELVFYSFFPVFILLSKFSKLLMAILSLMIFFIYFYFAFYKLSDQVTLDLQWKNYINPLNQLFLFLGGFLIGCFFEKIRVQNSTSIIILTAALGGFIFVPTTAEHIDLVVGWNRLIFTGISFLICFSFYKLSFKPPAIIDRILTILGESSYSIYLLHPIVYSVIKRLTNSMELRTLLSILVTIVISYLSYNYFEKYFIKLGKTRLRAR